MNENNNMNLYPEGDVRNAISVALSVKLYEQYGLEIEHDSFNHTVDCGIMDNFEIVEIDDENFIDIGDQSLDTFVEEATAFDIEDNSMFDAAVTQKYNVTEELYCGYELRSGHVASYLESMTNDRIQVIVITTDYPRDVFYVLMGRGIAVISSHYHKSKDHLASAAEAYVYALENGISKNHLLQIAEKLNNTTVLDFAIAAVKEKYQMGACSC